MAGSSQNKRGSTAFTLIELLVVVAIIAVLAAILLPAVSSARLPGSSRFGTSYGPIDR